MPIKTRYFNSMRLDVFQALKRAFMHRGFTARDPKLFLKNTQQPSPPQSQPNPDSLLSADANVSDGPQGVHEKLIDITEKAQDVLFKADTIFPFTLFPGTITLDREKLTVATRTFFKVAKIVSVPVSSISSAEVDVGPFFGSLHMASKFFVQNTYSVNFLTRGDAVRIQHLLQGFIIAQEKGVDVTLANVLHFMPIHFWRFHVLERVNVYQPQFLEPAERCLEGADATV